MREHRSDVAIVAVWHRSVYLSLIGYSHTSGKTHPLYIRGSVHNLRNGGDGILLEGPGKRLNARKNLVLHMTPCAIMPEASAFKWFRRLLTI